MQQEPVACHSGESVCLLALQGLQDYNRGQKRTFGLESIENALAQGNDDHGFLIHFCSSTVQKTHLLKRIITQKMPSHTSMQPSEFDLQTEIPLAESKTAQKVG